MSSNRMRRAWDRTRTIPGLGRDVSAVAGLLLLGMVAGGLILANQHVDWPWQNKFVFSADFKETPGISPNNGQEIRIAGVMVGTITGAEVTKNGAARLKFSIEPGHIIYSNARMVLRPKTPLNDMYVEMSEGTPDAKPLPAGAVIPESNTSNPVEVDAILQNLDEGARAALSSLLDESDVALAHAPENLSKGLTATDDSMRKFAPVLKALETRRAKIAQLVTSLSQVSVAAGGDDKRLASLTRSLNKTLGTIAARDDDLEATLKQLPGFVSALRASTGSIQSLSSQLDPTLADVKAASDSLPNALARLTAVADKVKRTSTIATPLVRKARPLVADLRPQIPEYDAALGAAEDITGRLDRSTSMLVGYLTDLRAFVYNTTSVVSLQDANGGILRGQTEIDTSSLPIALGRSN